MTFWEHFLRLLRHRPKPALAALYWYVTRRRVRARNRLHAASADLPFAYDVWIDRVERTPLLIGEFRRRMDDWTWRPRFSVLLHGSEKRSDDALDRSITSVERQIYPAWSVSSAAGDAIGKEIRSAEGEFVVLLRAGDQLSETALFQIAEKLQSEPKAVILYGDHDRIDRSGRRSRPWFKPRWNAEMFLAQDFLSPLVAIEIGLAKSAQDRDETPSTLLLSAVSAAGGPIIHVPHILCHAESEDEDVTAERTAAISRHLDGTGARCAPGPFGTTRIEWPLPTKLPLVSIIVPTKDRLDLLQPCIEGVLERTDYEEFELLIVDNASIDPATEKYLTHIADHPRVRVLPYPHCYNFSAINNFAAAEATGAYLCLLNNDTEVVEPAWLTELMRYAVRPDIGAAGAKLLYEDRTIQHAGVVVGIGEAAGHAHRFLPEGEPGYFRQPHVSQFVSAVTAACLVVEKSKFDAVGGLDEADLAVAFNDVDLCLKLQAAGWRNVYVPHAVLLHHESKSRGNDISPQNIDRYRSELKVLQERWGTKTYDDPLHNPNLDRYSETFVIAF